MYDVSKAAQAAAVLLAASPGESMGRLKLMKLLYLADRESFATYGATISRDRLVAMPHGPALSRTLGALQMEEAGPGEWTHWVEALDGKRHRLATDADLDEIDALSDAEIEVLHATWSKFGDMTGPELRRWTHDPRNCPEWTDPHGSSHVIDLQTLGDAVGMSASEVDLIRADQRQREEMRKILTPR